MKLSRVIRSVRRNLVVGIVIGVVLGALTAVLSFALAKPTYTATSTVVFTVAGLDQIDNPSDAANYGASLATTYAAMIRTPVVMVPVSQRVPDTDPNVLAAAVTVDLPRQNLVATLRYTDADPAKAEKVLTTVGEELRTLVAGMSDKVDGQPRITVGEQRVVVTTTAGSSGGLVISALKGAVVGLMALLAWLLARVLLDTKVHGSDDLASVTDSSILAHVRSDDDYAALAKGVPYLDAGRPASLLFASTIAGEGASATAVGTAKALAAQAEAGTVLLLDADLRDGAASAATGATGTGLSEILSGQAEWSAALTDQAGLAVIGRGAQPPNPTELLASPRLPALLAQLGERYATVVVAGTPLLTHSDSSLVADAVGGVVPVVGLKQVNEAQLTEALELVEAAGGHVLGVVLTDPAVH